MGNYRHFAVIIPHATLEPAFPVFKLPVSPPFPRSSLPLCTTSARPKMFALEFEFKLIILSWISTSVGKASELVKIFPRSPTCLFKLLGVP